MELDCKRHTKDMRCFDNGSYFSVTVNERGVRHFKRRWPCFGRGDAITFEFSKKDGDIVGVSRSVEHNDGTGIRALADDAKQYGALRLGLVELMPDSIDDWMAAGGSVP